jgi:hypothetical protein
MPTPEYQKDGKPAKQHYVTLNNFKMFTASDDLIDADDLKQKIQELQGLELQNLSRLNLVTLWHSIESCVSQLRQSTPKSIVGPTVVSAGFNRQDDNAGVVSSKGAQTGGQEHTGEQEHAAEQGHTAEQEQVAERGQPAEQEQLNS